MFVVETLTSPVPLTRIRMARTVLGRPMHEVSAYRIGDLLIDAGPPPTAGRLVAWCREALESTRTGGLSQVVLTHHHEDHSGGAAALQEGLGLPVLAPLRRITRQLLGREGFLAYASFGDFSKKNLLRSLLARPQEPPTLPGPSIDRAGRGGRRRRPAGSRPRRGR